MNGKRRFEKRVATCGRPYSFVAALTVLALIAALLLATGCGRGRPSHRPPVHFNPDMDRQAKYSPQGSSAFFADSAAMRMPPAGTVAQGQDRADQVFYSGKDRSGNYTTANPAGMTMETLKRGRERYDIYCSVCHSRVGDGRGIMITRGYVPPPSFHQDYLREKPDGYLFDVITNGVRNMPAYAHQIPVADRWAIIAYLRTLQRSRNGTINDIPQELRDKIAPGEP